MDMDFTSSYELNADNLSNDLSMMLGKRTNLPARKETAKFGSINKREENNLSWLTDPFAKIGDNAKYAANRAVNQARGIFTGSINSLKNAAISAITGDLGMALLHSHLSQANIM